MVIGSGLLAKSFANFQNNESFVLFCSGVSNSTCTNKLEFEREYNLLEKTITENEDKILIYFSTCSIYDDSLKNSLYIQHKLKIENFIQKKCHKFYIFRLSNVVGLTSNKYTILNYFYNCIEHEISFDLWKSSFRNIIDVDDVNSIVTYIIQHKLFQNEITNIANNNSSSVLEIVSAIEKYLSKKGNYELIEKGKEFKINTTKIQPILEQLQLSFNSNYIDTLLNKYYK